MMDKEDLSSFITKVLFMPAVIEEEVDRHFKF